MGEEDGLVQPLDPDSRHHTIYSFGTLRTLVITGITTHDISRIRITCCGKSSTAKCIVSDCIPTFTEHLQERTVVTDADVAEFEVHVGNRSFEVEWFLGSELLRPRGRYHIVSVGRVRQLMIDKMSLNDNKHKTVS